MEQKLKKQRGRLVRRVTLILTAVWLAVSATYCVLRLLKEKSDLQSDMLSALSKAKQLLSMSELETGMASRVYINDYNILYFKDMAEEDPDSQMKVIHPLSRKDLADTSGKVRVRFSLETDKGTYPDEYGYLDYETVRGLLSDLQYQRIAGLLREKPSAGGSNELVCTRFYFLRAEIVPLELAVMPVEDADGRFDPAGITETFVLSGSVPADTKVYNNSVSRINIIPKVFFLNDSRNGDFISSLTDEQCEMNFGVFSTGFPEYLFYSSEYLFLDAYVFNETTGSYENLPELYLLCYAKKADLLRSCGNDLVAGSAAVLGFFFVIGFILCLMIWRTVKIQLIQEQKRLDLTNALAHDIKTPLFVISGYAYSLKEDIDGDERDSYLDKIIGQTEQINGLVHKMLNLSKLDSCSVTLSRNEFALSDLVAEILDDYRSLPDGRTIAFSSVGNSGITGDRELLRTALQNLIENAVKYSPPGSEITVSVEDKTITVSNPSDPVTKAELKKMWQPYFRLDKSRHKKGNGLGLSIVKSILDLHSVRYEMNYRDGCMVFRAGF